MGTLTVEEFAGVLAHEFGHFTQGAAMRLSYLVRFVNSWLARVVYTYDSWDYLLDEMTHNSGHWVVFLIVFTAKMGVTLSRGILWVFMMLALAVSGSLSRQMEFNADAYEINLAGSETSERTTRKICLLNHSLEQTRKDMVRMFRSQRTLPDNVSKYLLLTMENMPAKIRNKIDSQLGLVKTPWYASHPCDADRIRQARRAQRPPLLSCAEPASSLFTNFEIPARAVTLFWYHDLRIPIAPEQLTAFRDEEKEQAERSENAAETLARYFCGAVPMMHPVAIPFQAIATDEIEAVRENMRTFRGRIDLVRPQVETAVANYTSADARALQMVAAKSALACSATIDAAQFELPEASADAVEHAEREAIQTKTEIAHSMRVVTDSLRNHLVTALALLRLPAESQWLTETAERIEAARPHLDLVNQMALVWPLLMECRNEHAVLAALCGLSRNLAAQRPLGASSRRLETLMGQLRNATIAMANPFERKKGARCIFDQLAQESPGSATKEIEARAQIVVRGFILIYEHSLAELAKIGMQIEAEC